MGSADKEDFLNNPGIKQFKPEKRSVVATVLIVVCALGSIAIIVWLWVG